MIFGRLRQSLGEEKAVAQRPGQPDVPWLQRLQASAIERLTEHDRKAIAMFVELIVDPASSRSRLTETIDLDERAVTQQVSISFTLPDAEDGGRALYIPVLQPMKGELVDNFHLWSAGGGSIPTLSYEETTRLAAAGLRLILMEIFAGKDAPSPPTTLEEPVRAAELALLQIVATRGPLNGKRVHGRMDVILEEIKFPNDESKERVRKYVAALSWSYPIVAVVAAPDASSGRFLLKYEPTFIPASLTRSWRGLLRLGLGLKPDKVAIPVELALTAESYHLRVNAPTNKYVLKQFLQCRHCRVLLTRQWRGKEPAGMPEEKNGSGKEDPDRKLLCAHQLDSTRTGQDDLVTDHHFRVRRKRGQNFVHVYMRGYSRAAPKLRDLQLITGFKETPPGARGRATVTALATTLLIAVAGNLVTDPQGAQVGGLPALMLALPAVAASWFGVSSDKDALVGGSLLARLSLVVSGVVSVIAVVLYLGSPPPTVPTPIPGGSVADPLTFVGITDWRWITLCVVSALNLFYVSYRFALKLVHFNDLITREDLGAGDFAWR
ncbi:hypothetical protein ACFOW4_12945 [Micromonospora sp. GCM10011542]|uniref:hypothetical protein n=1 Tax=Micromonospora sp. GCM10011542 TaxID=3317337 RepID=UPI00361AE30A